MMDFNLQQTTFHIEKIRAAVNVGRVSAYQVVTMPGPRLGRIGKVAPQPFPPPANDSEFLSASRFAGRAWFKRTLAALKS